MIYQPFFKNIASSLLSAAVDITVFMLLVGMGQRVFWATVLARIISGAFNFSLNKRWVFHKQDSHDTGHEFLKYLALFTLQMVFSVLLTSAFSELMAFRYGLLFSKILADIILFTTNFIVQRFWIFPHNTLE